MNVYYSASPAGIYKYGELYGRTVKQIESLGHTLTSRWFADFDKSFFDLPRDEWKNHYRTITEQISKSDVSIWDISVSSTSCGQGIQYALFQKKPVIILQNNSSEKNIFLEGAGEVESKLLAVEYSENDLEVKLKDALEYVEDWLETRFTMILDGQTRNMLDSVTKSGKSRSDYIRELIKKDFEEKKNQR